MKIYKKSLLYGALAFTLCMAGGCNSNIDPVSYTHLTLPTKA